MRAKHIAYYNLLEAFEAEGCPVCSLMAQAVRKHAEWLMYEGVNDPGMRQKLIRSRGFCAQHGELMIEIGHPLGLALIYGDIVDSVSSSLTPARRPRTAGSSSATCPACGWAKESESQYLSAIADHFADKELRVRVFECRAFCLPHLEKLLELLPAPEQEVLRQAALAHLSELGFELSEIVRKSEYRCEEPWGPEGNAWKRAVRKISGRRRE
jgi:hypothetical protein